MLNLQLQNLHTRSRKRAANDLPGWTSLSCAKATKASDDEPQQTGCTRQHRIWSPGVTPAVVLRRHHTDAGVCQLQQGAAGRRCLRRRQARRRDADVPQQGQLPCLQPALALAAADSAQLVCKGCLQLHAVQACQQRPLPAEQPAGSLVYSHIACLLACLHACSHAVTSVLPAWCR